MEEQSKSTLMFAPFQTVMFAILKASLENLWTLYLALNCRAFNIITHTGTSKMKAIVLYGQSSRINAGHAKQCCNATSSEIGRFIWASIICHQTW
jgi:hypothetical protein